LRGQIKYAERLGMMVAGLLQSFEKQLDRQHPIVGPTESKLTGGLESEIMLLVREE
jgi:hypothetical protein